MRSHLLRGLHRDGSGYSRGNKMLCGAKTKKGTPCRYKALANGRCRLHGGIGPEEAERCIKDIFRKNGITDDDVTFFMKGILIPIDEYAEKVIRSVDQSESIH